MKTLALVMIVKNEERSLAHCLEQVRGLVDKIYITDTGSTDRTKEIAKSFGAIVSDFVWEQDFSTARNFALAQSDCDWNLVLDADEYLLEGSRKELETFMENPKQLGAIERMDAYMEIAADGSQEVSYAYCYTPRLFPKGVGYTGKIHEQPDSKLPIFPLPLLFEHDGYLQDGKAERNLAILLEEVKQNPRDSYFLFQTAQTLRGLKRHKEACKYYAKFYQYVPVKGTGYRVNGIIAWLYSLIEVENWKTAFSIVEKEEKIWVTMRIFTLCVEYYI